MTLPLSICTWFFEFSSLKYQVGWTGFFPSLNWNFLPAVACKIQVWNRLKIKFIKLDTYFKLENCKNRVQIDRGSDIVHFRYIWKWPLSEKYCTCLFLINGFWSHLLSEFSFEYIYISFLDFFWQEKLYALRIIDLKYNLDLGPLTYDINVNGIWKTMKHDVFVNQLFLLFSPKLDFLCNNTSLQYT